MLNSMLLPSIIKSSRLPENQPLSFAGVSTDTRTLQEGDLFVPLIGEQFNGHQFVEAAIESGAIASLWQVDQPLPEKLPDLFQLYFVDDTLKALQRMAKAYRDQVNPFVIGITGSNGKTTTKDILYSILSTHGETYKTQGNYNNHIGLPLTILSMPSSCEYLILEMGMSGFGEISFLSELARPNEAIVTNIGESHMEQLGSREGIAKAKMEIQDGLAAEGTVFFDGDEPLLSSFKRASHCYSVGFSKESDAFLADVKVREEGYSFTYTVSSNDADLFDLPLLGKHNIKNAGYCIALTKKMGLDYKLIRESLHKISLTGMRLERTVGSKGELIINDAYNASPSSMIAAIETLKTLPRYKKYIAVLGDMYELGASEESLHRMVAGAIGNPITHLVIVGEKAKWIADEWRKKGTMQIDLFVANDKEEATAYLHTIIDKYSVILFKASRGMKLEEIIRSIQSGGKEDDK